MTDTYSIGTPLHVAISTSPVSRSMQEANEPASGPDNDADRDDQVVVQPKSSTPAVHAMGETVGQLINVSA